MKEEEVRDMMGGTPTEVSLNAPVGEEGDMRLEEVIEDHSITPVTTSLLRSLSKNSFRSLLGQLDDKERLIIERRFGLGDRNLRRLRRSVPTCIFRANGSARSKSAHSENSADPSERNSCWGT